MVDSWALLASGWATIWTQNLIQWLHFPGYCTDSGWKWHCQHKPALHPANHLSTWSPSQILLVEVYPGHITSSKHECQIETEQPYTLTKVWHYQSFQLLEEAGYPALTQTDTGRTCIIYTRALARNRTRNLLTLRWQGLVASLLDNGRKQQCVYCPFLVINVHSWFDSGNKTIMSVCYFERSVFVSLHWTISVALELKANGYNMALN